MIPPEARATRLREVQNLKMARSAHAYVRGSTVKFYEWLNAGPADLPTAQPPGSAAIATSAISAPWPTAGVAWRCRSAISIRP